MAPNERVATWLPRGTPVQVRDRLEFAFRSGFEVSDNTDGGYRLRRRSDGVELPMEFSVKDVRADSTGTTWR